MARRELSILGTRGIPAAHGGFETFAERLALYLVERGWRVVVYCQEHGQAPTVEDTWHDVQRVRIPVSNRGAPGTLVFDFKATLHAGRGNGLILTLGYNTAVFCALYRLKGLTNLINMDGIEWLRQKWGIPVRGWFYLNDWAGCWLGTHLIADHPAIEDHLARRVSSKKITMIPYGSDRILDGSLTSIKAVGLEPRRFVTLIARPEPENSVLEVVSAFSRKQRSVTLAVIGNYDGERNRYHRKVLQAAGPEVQFLGAIYDPSVLTALRYHSCLYIHGHQVGGTNPSLVEALGAGNPVLAHDNRFNRWVAGERSAYFFNGDQCAAQLDRLLGNEAELSMMRDASLARHAERFTWNRVLGEYEQLLERFVR